MRLRTVLSGALLAGVVACSPADVPRAVEPPPTPAATPAPTPDQGVFFIDRAMDHVRALAVEIGWREAGTPGDDQAAAYIADQLDRLGWRSERRAFPLPQGGESWNVVGVPAGFDEGAPYLIVGGHYDSLRGPGANDNATGVAAALDIVRALDARPADLPVKFIAFGAEEVQPAPGRPHHVGSRHYVAQMSDEARANLVAFVNLDMVGHGDTIFCGRMSAGPTEGTERCVQTAEALGIDARERITPDWSDNGPFLREGMNAAWLWTGELPCCYHNPRDTIDVVRPHDVERSGRLALEILRSYTR